MVEESGWCDSRVAQGPSGPWAANLGKRLARKCDSCSYLLRSHGLDDEDVVWDA